MPIGTAILTAIDCLIEARLFEMDSRSGIFFIVGLVIEFAVQIEETCTINEDGWRFIILQKADQHGATPTDLT